MVRYFIADPSYVFGTKQYEYLCDSLDASSDWEYYHDPISNLHLFKTKFGDGLYPIYKGEDKVGEIFVDTGMLCCGPDSLIKKRVRGPFEKMLIFYVDLDTDQVEFKGHGDFQVGDFYVNTSNEDTVSAKFYRDYKEQAKEGEKAEVSFDVSPFLVNEILKDMHYERGESED